MYIVPKKYLIKRKKKEAMRMISKAQYLLSCIQADDNNNLIFWSSRVGECVDLRNKIFNKI